MSEEARESDLSVVTRTLFDEIIRQEHRIAELIVARDDAIVSIAEIRWHIQRQEHELAFAAAEAALVAHQKGAIEQSEIHSWLRETAAELGAKDGTIDELIRRFVLRFPQA